jgi:ELWxxDGT repeat protein
MLSHNLIDSLEARRLLSSSVVADSAGIYPTDSVTLNGVSYFAADDGVHGKELWKSNGTTTGTMMVRDLVPGSTGADVQSFDVVNGHVLFFATCAPGHIGIFTTDGTTGGTVLLKDIGHNYGPPFTAVTGAPGKQRLVFAIEFANTGDPTPWKLWSSDGSAVGTIKLQELNWVGILPDVALVATHNRLPMAGDRAVFFCEQGLLSTDGTAGGTISLTKTSPSLVGFGDADPGCITEVNGELAFLMMSTDANLFITDGTPQGTQWVMKIGLSQNHLEGIFSYGIFAVGDKIYLPEHFVKPSNTAATYAQTLWASDGTPAGSFKLVSFDPSAIDLVWSVGGKALFMGYDSEHGKEPWISDGTPNGTHLLKDLHPGPTETPFGFAREINGITYFLGADGRDAQGNNGHMQIWCTDGTEAGTVLVRDLAQYLEWDYNVSISAVDGKILGHVDEVQAPHRTVETFVLDPALALPAVGLNEGTITIRNGIMRVFGTLHSDDIRIYRWKDDLTKFVVNINGRKRAFALADVRGLVIYGYSGDDSIRFKDDVGIVPIRSSIFGGAGNDTILGGYARDTIFGEQGNDSIIGGASNDSIFGGDGNDRIIAGDGNDTVNGGNGPDALSGGAGNDMLNGGDDQSNDRLDGGEGADVLFGQAVYDVFFTNTSEAGTVIDDVLQC